MSSYVSLLIVVSCVVAATIANRYPEFQGLRYAFAVGGAFALLVFIGQSLTNRL